MLNTQQTLELDDGRVVDCPSPAEARFLWGEITSATGFYRQPAARLRPGDIALDIGANIGLSSIPFAAAEVHDSGGRLAEFRDLLGTYGLSARIRQDASLRGTDLHEVYAVRDERTR